MDFTTSSQLTVFAWSIAGGMLCAFVFDLFRIVRRVQRRISAVQVFVQDVVFFIILAVVMFVTYLYANDSDVRGYEFLGTLLGAVIYFVVISRILTHTILFCGRILKKAIGGVLKVLFAPLVWFLRLFRRPARFMVIKFSGLFRRIGRFFRKLWKYFMENFKKLFVISKKV